MLLDRCSEVRAVADDELACVVGFSDANHLTGEAVVAIMPCRI